MDWGCKIRVTRIDKGERVDDMAKMPWMTWFMPAHSTSPLLFIRTGDKCEVIKNYGEMMRWDAGEVWEKIKPATLLCLSSVGLVGDDRPYVD